MRKISIAYLLLSFIMLLQLSVAAQTIIFRENVGSTNQTTNISPNSFSGWEKFGVGAGAVTYSSTTNVQVIAATSSNGYPTASGGNDVYLLRNATTTPTFTTSSINIAGYHGLTLSFGLFRGASTLGGDVKVIVTVDGGAPVSYEYTGVAFPQGWAYYTFPVTIPTGSSMTIAFQNLASAAASPNDGSNARLDDILLTGNINLPVSFGNIEAALSGGMIQLRWIAFTEINNSRFDIEASQDGNSFTKIATIQSKAPGGDSTSAIEYSYSISKNNLFSLLGIPALTILLSLTFLKKGHRFIITLLALSLMSIQFISCKKDNNALNNNGSKVFLRIKQVDIDGNAQYSKIIQVVNKD